VDLVLVHGVTIRGHIVTEIPVKTMRGVYVSVMSPDSVWAGYLGSSYGGQVQDDKGNFEIHGVPPGSYILSAGVYDTGHSYSGRALVDVGNTNVDGVTVVVDSGLTLRGRVRLSSRVKLDLTHLSVYLRPAENYMEEASAQVKADGAFVLENIYDGTYRVNAVGFPEEFYLQSVRLAGADILGPGLTVSSNSPLGNLDVVLSKDGGRLEGVVLKDQQPAGGAIVVLVPEPPNRGRDDLYSSKTTDLLGRFSLLGLPPGDFKLFAFEPREGLAFTDPDFLKEYEDRGTRVHIEDRKQQFVQLQIIPVPDDPP
jgi:hypothetical protein